MKEITVNDPSGSIWLYGQRIPNKTYKPKDKEYGALAGVVSTHPHVKTGKPIKTEAPEPGGGK